MTQINEQAAITYTHVSAFHNTLSKSDGDEDILCARTNSPGWKISMMMNGLSEVLSIRTNVQLLLTCTALAAGIFVVDVSSLPLGVATGVAYVGVVLISLWLPGWHFSFIVAAGVSILTILGFLLSEPAGIPWMVVANRLLTLFAIWFTAIVGSWLVSTVRNKSELELQQAEQEVDRARNAKSRFLETASNDMRHHLHTLSLLNGALRKTVIEPKAHKMFAMQAEALAHLSDLLNSLLELGKLESGEVELKIDEIPIQDIFRKLQDEFEGQAQAKGLQLHFDSQTEVAHSDRMLLTRIVRIFISNAIRYTKQGVVNVNCRREAEGIEITVQDSGIGMAPDQLARIFDEFYRVDNDPVGKNDGLGLGLTIVERSVNLLGAKVEVESELGQGSRFSIGVPSAV
jgi:signal transduction histidine kinase